MKETTPPSQTRRSPRRLITSLHSPRRRWQRVFLPFLAATSLSALTAQAASNYTGAYYFTTLAGMAQGGDARIPYPTGIAVDRAGNVYVWC